MKKLLLFPAVFFGSLIALKAQVPNGGFENWGAALSQPSEPTNWVTGNILAAPIVTFPSPNTNPTSAYKATATGEFNSGTAAMKVTTVKLNSNPLANSGINDTIGFALVGQAQLSPTAGLVRGFQFTGRPDKFEFFYRYTPTGADNAGATAILTKWVNGKRDTVAKAFFTEASMVGSFTGKAVQFIYTPAYDAAGNPDTAIVGFASSVGSLFNTYPVRPKIGSALWVDDVSFSGTHIGVKELTKAVDIRSYPNPASAFVMFTASDESAAKVEIFDLTGKKVGVASFEERKVKVNTENLADGLYIYRILNSDRKVITTGKLNINN